MNLRSNTMAEECRDHWYGPPYNKKRSSKRRWAYSYLAMSRLRKASWAAT